MKKKSGKYKSCWEGYEAFGTKLKNGRTVPNCVPKKKKRSKKKDINEAKHGGGLAHCRKSHEKTGAFGLFHFYAG